MKYSFANFPNLLRRGLAEDGFIIIEPDGATFRTFSTRLWHLQSFLARKGDSVYVPLIHARNPQCGAFSRLVHDIEVGAGLQMAVLAPLEPMRTILKNWLYEPKHELILGNIEEVWRATRGVSPP